MGFKGWLINFLAAVGGQTVHHQRVFVGFGHECFIDLIIGKVRFPLGRFLFHSHGDPYVGV